jgi:outer membrane usher protein
MAQLLIACGSIAATPVIAADSDVLMQLAAADDELAVLAVSLNGRSKDGVAYVLRDRRDGLMIDQASLQRLGLRFSTDRYRELDGRFYVPLTAVPGLVWNIIDDRQQLDLRIDPAMLPASTVPFSAVNAPLPRAPDWGGYVNYGLFASRSSGANRNTVSGAFTASMFGPNGVGVATALANPQSPEASDFVLLDLNWRWDDPTRMRSTTVGDAISAPSWWGRPIRFGGVQLNSNFALQPGFVTTPLLAVSGLAGVPSTTEILSNNVRLGTQDVPAGPFTISNIPVITGAGELQLIVRDAFGQQRVITQPYYVASQLLGRGIAQYSLSAGSERYDYGLRNFRYRDAYGSGWLRRGLSDQLTAEVRAEADSSSAAAGFGADYLIGTIGVLSTGFAGSQSKEVGSGYRWLLGFDRSSPFLSFGARSSWASRDYREIGDTGTRIRRASSAIVQAPTAAGSFALAWTGQSFYNAPKFDLYSATYSVPVAGAFATLALSRSISNGARQTSGMAFLTIPLGQQTSASAAAQHHRRGDHEDTRGEVAVQRGLPLGQGIGYYLRANTDRQSSGGFSYGGPYGRYSAEVSTTPRTTAVRANIDGGIAWLGGEVMAAQPIEQSFALVDVGGIAGVRVLQENNEAGRTNREGRLMLTNLPPYSAIKISLDPLTVPMDVAIAANETRVAALPRAGVIARFDARRERRAAVRIVYRDGTAIPAGAVVRVEGRAELFPVGAEGEVFLTGLAEQQWIEVLANGRSCRLELVIKASDGAVADIGPLYCEPTTRVQR